MALSTLRQQAHRVRCFDSRPGLRYDAAVPSSSYDPPAQVTPVTHSAATLHYFLLDGRPRLEPLRVFDVRRVLWGGRVVTFFALGTSHAVVVEKGDIALTELLTCAAGDLEAHVLEQRAVGIDCVISRAIDSLRYDCQLSPFELDAGDGLQGDFSEAEQLIVKYGVGQGAEEPMTHIGWRIEGAMLSVETLHTYPHEGRGVRSQSTFRLSVRPNDTEKEVGSTKRRMRE